MRIVDSHVHFYDPGRPEGILWPKPDQSIYGRFMPGDYRNAGLGFTADSVIAVEVNPRAADDRWLFALAESEPHIAAVVANLQYDTPVFADNLAFALTQAKFRGIRLRPIASLDFDSDRLRSDLNLLARQDSTVPWVVEAGCPDPKVWSRYTRLAAEHPKLCFVLDHAGHPKADGSRVSAGWVTAMAAFAGLPNTACKLTHLGRSLKTPPDVNVGPFREAVDALRHHFGPRRMMFGSNWPPALADGIEDHFRAICEAFSGNQNDLAWLLGRSAAAVYRL